MLQELERQRQSYKSVRDRLMKPPAKPKPKPVEAAKVADKPSVPPPQPDASQKDNIVYCPPPFERFGHVFGRAPKCREIQEVVAKFYRIKHIDLLAQRRHKDVMMPRHIAVYICTKATRRSLPEIGHRFNGRDHTTMINSRNKIERMILEDDVLADDIEIIRIKLAQHMAAVCEEERSRRMSSASLPLFAVANRDETYVDR